MTAHYNLANYLSRAVGKSAEQRAHRLTASLLDHLTGDTLELTSHSRCWLASSDPAAAEHTLAALLTRLQGPSLTN